MTRYKTFDEYMEDKFPDKNKDYAVYHEITWWLERELTLEEWAELDKRQSQIFDDMNIEVSGVAGPIPEIGRDKKENNV